MLVFKAEATKGQRIKYRHPFVLFSHSTRIVQNGAMKFIWSP